MSRCWLRTAPVIGRPVHPLLLDLLDDALWRRPDDPLLAAAAAAAAPLWAELDPFVGAASGDGSGAGNRSLAALLERGDGASHIFVVHATASALAGLGPDFGALICRSSSYGPSDRRFLARLTDNGHRTGFAVRLVDPPRRSGALRMSRDIAAMLASCPQGAPLEILDDLGIGAPDVPVAVQRGPAGRPWAATTGSSPVVGAAAAPLIDRWPSDGWDYLRRSGVTTTSGTPEQRRHGHDAYLLGMATLDPDLTLAHLAARSADLESAASSEATEIHAFAMQLATSIGTDDRRRQAVEFGGRALRHAPTGDERFRILLDIGVAHAALRDDESLDRAAAVCAQARALPEPGRDVAQLVRLLNLEALVAYHRGLDHQAIDLEARALELATTGDAAAVDMAPTLRRNMARVLSRRLGDNDGAARLLARNAEGRAGAHAARARDVVELACAYFDEGRFDDVVRTLQSDDRRSLDLELDVVGYTLLIRSLVAIGDVDQARSLLPALRRSATLLGCDAAFAPTA